MLYRAGGNNLARWHNKCEKQSAQVCADAPEQQHNSAHANMGSCLTTQLLLPLLHERAPVGGSFPESRDSTAHKIALTRIHAYSMHACQAFACSTLMHREQVFESSA
jgi:hypothetical protein